VEQTNLSTFVPFRFSTRAIAPVCVFHSRLFFRAASNNTARQFPRCCADVSNKGNLTRAALTHVYVRVGTYTCCSSCCKRGLGMQRWFDCFECRCARAAAWLLLSAGFLLDIGHRPNQPDGNTAVILRVAASKRRAVASAHREKTAAGRPPYVLPVISSLSSQLDHVIERFFFVDTRVHLTLEIWPFAAQPHQALYRTVVSRTAWDAWFRLLFLW